MSFAGRFERAFHNLLPSPFALAVLLTFAVFGAAVLFFKPAESDFLAHGVEVVSYWYDGIWNAPLLVFGYQMMLILVLGHVLALAPPVDDLIKRATKYCDSTAKAAAIVTVSCILLGLINWGLALIFGAIFARKVGEYAVKKGNKINYPLIGACGYTGLLVWHGGISGSSTIKAAEEGHLASLLQGSKNIDFSALPSAVSFSETVFSPMNLSVSLALLIVLPFSAYAIGKNSISTHYILHHFKRTDKSSKARGIAEKLDFHPALALILGFSALITAAAIATRSIQSGDGNFVNPNFINTAFLGFGLIAHGNLSRFAEAIEEAIQGASGILIQFPLYFGILGMMKGAGIVSEISTFFVSISNQTTYPIFSFLSAGFVNILVPSGGGQWMVQGPIIIEASQQMGLDLGKSIMSMAYGDQLTNMLQPFWALPLLSITGLKAKEILPFTFFFMLIAAVIYIAALLIF
jgi:short-chain fatty acids transporter